MTVRVGGFQDELLASCTETLLSAPAGLLGGNLGSLVPALKVALTSGASHLPTALVAVTALEKWNDENPALLAPFLGEVRFAGPCLFYVICVLWEVILIELIIGLGCLLARLFH